MKKLLLLGASVLLLASCTKHGEEIDATKQKLKEIGASSIDDYDFQTDEILGRDVYRQISEKHTKISKDFQDLGDYDNAKAELDESMKAMQIGGKNKDAKYVIVKAFLVKAGDTLHKTIFYIDDKNEVVDFTNVK